MKKNLSILLSLVLVFALTACGGDATSSDSANGSQSASGSQAVSAVAPQDWPPELPVPAQNVESIQWSTDYSAAEITMDEEWTAEEAQAYGNQCVEAGFEMWESGEIQDGTYFNEGLTAEGTAIVSVASGGEEGWDIMLTYVNS